MSFKDLPEETLFIISYLEQIKDVIHFSCYKRNSKCY